MKANELNTIFLLNGPITIRKAKFYNKYHQIIFCNILLVLRFFEFQKFQRDRDNKRGKARARQIDRESCKVKESRREGERERE